MGQNRRYGSDITDEAVHEMATRPQPISLGKAELGDEPVKEADRPIAVSAWVRFPESPIRVRCTAIAWTSKAVRVEFTMKDGAVRRAWVWASAVERV
ncbi:MULTISPECIES: hypothetical protein [unclassified Leifsonia]|uniref:hypothetical protein n=1 Tax=unclassified Leifsonia TaxID=2663824 RepID=UPI0006F60B17|nr:MULTISPECIES: hypothetical protein [unclassified Leifsonia]KQX05298.1 hypothetical protein ASC59_14100 [Leifsonia sp. Root1293]KRA08931.1 hypothetical protein ASD61_14100 [Leifsonia sp. Root60]